MLPEVPQESVIDPSPEIWLTEDRRTRLTKDIAPSLPLLLLSGQCQAVLDYWIRLELADEAAKNSQIWSEADRNHLLKELNQSWKQQYPDGHPFLTDEQVARKLLVNPGSQLWARDRWGHRLESMFLDNKNKLDVVSFRMLRVDDKHLASELYYRLCANECTFEAAVNQYGTIEDQKKGGLWTSVACSNLPNGLAPILSGLDLGQLSPPLRLGNQAVIIQLHERLSAKLDPKVEKKLLMAELSRWIHQMIPHLLSHLQ